MDWTTVLIASLPFLLLLIYRHFTRTFDHWEKKGVYYLKPSIFFGNVKDRFLLRKSFHEVQLDLYRKFEPHPYAGFFEGRRPVLMVRDPELIKHVMVRDFEHFVDRPTLNLKNRPHISNMLINLKGSLWKTVRAILTPTFSSGKLKSMETIVVQCGTQMTQYLMQNVTEKSDELEMKDFFGRFTIDVIATCAFGVQCDSLKDPNDEFIKQASKFNDIPVPTRVMILAVLFIYPPLIKYLPLSFFNDKSLAFLVKVASETKIYREKNPSAKRNDFLQLLIDSAQKEQEEEKNEQNDKTEGKVHRVTKQSPMKVMSEDMISAQALLFLLAGYETSSTLLSYAAYELALNPDVQEKVRNEIDSVLSKYEGQCTYESLQEMHYLEMVFSETLRMHPPVARVDRTCTKAYTIPGTQVQIDENDSVSIPVMGLHYEPLYFPNPDVFDPDRFKPEEKAKRSPYVFLPFGAGPRNCIGARFAIMSTKVGMVHLLKDFSLKVCERTDVPSKINKHSMLLKAEGGIWLRVERISAEC